jgi:excisionase family DNA binding protein
MENKTYAKPKPPKGWLWTEDAAEYLGVHPTTLYRWRRDDYGPGYVQHGRRRYRYRIAELDRWLDLEASPIRDNEYAAA